MRNPLERYPELLTDIVFLVGNGGSRKGFDLNTLRGKGTIIGCNALYRDFTPDILICQDSKMARELKDNDYSGLVLSGQNIGVKLKRNIVWKPGNARTSGAFGLKFIARIIRPNICYTIGMDGYAGNIYKGTVNYKNEPTKYHKFIEQYTENIGRTKIINVNKIDSWNTDHPNYEFITYEQFMGI